MPRIHIKEIRTILAAGPAVVMALVLVFNFAKPTLGNFDDLREGTPSGHFHAHDHEVVPVQHHGHPPHTHKHTHADGTTHEHQHHDEHCVKTSSNTIIWAPISHIVPTGIWSLVLSNRTTPNFHISTHYSELLRPPILA